MGKREVRCSLNNPDFRKGSALKEKQRKEKGDGRKKERKREMEEEREGRKEGRRKKEKNHLLVR